MDRREAGNEGEEAALAHLKRLGLKLIARNYRCRAGEIDLIMLDGETLALIEVRFRATSDFGGPAASVTQRKRRRIIKAAGHLLLTRADLRRHPARFDVIGVSPGLRGAHIEWIKAAFTM
jgi:putative endonuclease